jgi:hypothetical protein
MAGVLHDKAATWKRNAEEVSTRFGVRCDSDRVLSAPPFN